MIAKSSVGKNKKSVDDFGSLKDLIASAPEPITATVIDVSDTRQAVIDLMADMKGRTVDEIARQLTKQGHTESTVYSTVRLLEVAGYFNTTKGTGKVIHTIKPGACEGPVSRRKSVRPFKLPDQAVINPVGVISRNDDVDVAIWKASSDHKPRTASQIAEILAQFGFDALFVRNRAIVLMRRNWFIRRERNTGTTYELRRDVPMPKASLRLSMPEPNVGREELVTTFRPRENETITAIEEPAMPAPKVEPVQESILETQKLTPADLSPKAGDSISLMIWKVMCDYRPYTSADIRLLLSDLGVLPQSIYGTMTTLHHAGWFDREKTGTPLRYTYTLRRDTPMPTMDHDRFPEVPVAPHEELPTKPVENTTMTVKPTPVADAPLIEVAVKIKGRLFSQGELKQLSTELEGLGYGGGSQRRQTGGLIQMSLTIKGTEFTADELDTLAYQLKGMSLR